jgi:HSP20 family protein
MPKMELIKIRFGSESDPSNAAVEKNLTDLFRSVHPRFNCSDCPWSPPMDMIETRNEIIIYVEIAGVDREELIVEISGRTAKISGRRRIVAPKAHTTYRLVEINYGGFERTLHLPRVVDSERVSASYSDGMLEIHLAKQLQQRPYRVPISEE